MAPKNPAREGGARPWPPTTAAPSYIIMSKTGSQAAVAEGPRDARYIWGVASGTGLANRQVRLVPIRPNRVIGLQKAKDVRC